MRGTLALYLIGLVSGREGLRDAGMGCAAAQAQAIPRSLGFYKLISRERPTVLEVIDGDMIIRRGDAYRIRFPGESTWYDNSFYGGHVANLATCIAFWNYRFNLSYAEPVLWLAVAGMAAARMADEAHWLSDELFGAAFGTAIGKYVADRSKARRNRWDGPDSGSLGGSLRGGPSGERLLARDGAMTVVGWRVRF